MAANFSSVLLTTAWINCGWRNCCVDCGCGWGSATQWWLLSCLPLSCGGVWFSSIYLGNRLHCCSCLSIASIWQFASLLYSRGVYWYCCRSNSGNDRFLISLKSNFFFLKIKTLLQCNKNWLFIFGDLKKEKSLKNKLFLWNYCAYQYM